jgi:hypothetical protein
VVLGGRGAAVEPGPSDGLHGAVTHEVRGRRVEAADEPAQAGAGDRRTPLFRVAAFGLVAITVLGVAVATGVVWAGTDGRHGAAAPTASTTLAREHAAPNKTPTSWADVLAGLDQARSRAFAAADPSALDAVYAAGSPALARDRLRVAQLRHAGLTAQGVRLDTQSVRVVRSSQESVVLRVVDVMPPYRLVAPGGGTAASRPGRPAEQWSVTLVWAGGQWCVHDVRRAQPLPARPAARAPARDGRRRTRRPAGAEE